MKNNKFIKLILLSVFIIANGCNDLTEEPLTFLAPSNFFKTKSQVDATYTSAMDRIWNLWANAGYSYGWRHFAMDDQLAGVYERGLVIEQNHAYELWAGHYRSIADINGAIRGLKSGSVENASPGETDVLIAVGEFLRGFNYFQLVRLWGGVPLYLENDDPILLPEAKATIEEVYESILNDLTDAALKLPSSWADGSKGKPTSGAANAVLAKVYLTMATAPLNKTENYEEAALTAEKVMEAGYSLVYSINDVFLEENKFSSEMIWSFNSTKDDPSTPAQIWGPSESPYLGWNDFRVDVSWDSLYVQQPRKDAYLLDSLKGKHYTQWADNLSPAVKKFLPPNISWEEHASMVAMNSVPIIRYADVLLIFAEATNMTNGSPTQPAVDAINEVRNRANGYVVNPNYPLLTTGMTKDEFDEAVIQERNLELCFEFDRWFDICRKRLLEKLILPGQPLYKYRSDFTVDDYLMPIPEDELRNNTLVEQNPGYLNYE